MFLVHSDVLYCTHTLCIPSSTYIHSLGKTLTPVTGGMLSFCGGEILHSGDPVIEGVRYIIAAFCYVDLVSKGVVDCAHNQSTSKAFVSENKSEKSKEKSQSFSFGFNI